MAMGAGMVMLYQKYGDTIVDSMNRKMELAGKKIEDMM